MSVVMRPHPINPDTTLLPPPAWPLRGEGADEDCDRVAMKLRLYVAGDAPNSALARTNLFAMVKKHLWNNCEIEVVDLLQTPGRGILDKIRMTPTLLKLTPGPPKRIVGTLNDPRRVLRILGVSDRIP